MQRWDYMQGASLVFLAVLTVRSAQAQQSLPRPPSADKESNDEEAADKNAAPGEIEVITVQGAPLADLEQSAEAVTVIDTQQAQKLTADLGEVLARTEGVGVRRGGGLGSTTRFSINGLTDEQIRFFLDGVPLSFAGYRFGIANVPVNLIDEVQLFRGVVPIRFGADALGGAVNLVSERRRGTGAAASYQAGSFDTHRATLTGGYLDADSGAFVESSGFFDYSENDFVIDEEVTDTREATRGRPVAIEARRFNDGYQAIGANLEFGLVDQTWADELSARLFVTDFFREVQTTINQDRPFGEVHFDERTLGGTLRFVHSVVDDAVDLDVVAGYSRSETDFTDLATCIYNWLGQCTRERQGRGEISNGQLPRDDSLFETSILSRFNASWQIDDFHRLALSVSPTRVSRDGEDRLRTTEEASLNLSVEAERELTSLVTGLEYTGLFAGERVELISFVKNYTQWLRSSEPVPGGAIDRASSSLSRFGAGGSVRFEFSSMLDLKASYEYAVRLPEAVEVFGDNLFAIDNVELEPEVSHNGNLGAIFTWPSESLGEFRASVNTFLRESDDLIALLPGQAPTFRYENIFSARSYGVEGALGWSSPDDVFIVGANATYLDFRNTSGDGAYAQFEGDRIPNRPYAFVNGNAELGVSDLYASSDRLALNWNTRFVGEFFEFWESAGTPETKATIDTQLVHSLAISYGTRVGSNAISFAAELSNLTNERVFDFFGAQRPGRAAFFKTTFEL